MGVDSDEDDEDPNRESAPGNDYGEEESGDDSEVLRRRDRRNMRRMRIADRDGAHGSDADDDDDEDDDKPATRGRFAPGNEFSYDPSLPTTATTTLGASFRPLPPRHNDDNDDDDVDAVEEDRRLDRQEASLRADRGRVAVHPLHDVLATDP